MMLSSLWAPALHPPHTLHSSIAEVPGKKAWEHQTVPLEFGHCLCTPHPYALYTHLDARGLGTEQDFQLPKTS